MGPHLFRYGKNADTAREEVDTFVASMGPHLFRYGKNENIPTPSVVPVLQWGHIFSDMERADRGILCGSVSIIGFSRTLGFHGGSHFDS